MSDGLETEMRERFDEATRSLHVSEGFWEEVERRARRRTIRTRAATALSAAAAMAVVVVAVSWLTGGTSPSVPVVAPPPTQPAVTSSVGEWMRVVEGSLPGGETWALSARTGDDGREVCMLWRVLDETRSGRTCSPTDSSKWVGGEILVAFPWSAPEPLIGRVSDQVAEVELVYEHGPTARAELLRPEGLPTTIFVIEQDPERARTRLVARDHEGQVVFERDMREPTYPGCPLDPVAITEAELDAIAAEVAESHPAASDDPAATVTVHEAALAADSDRAAAATIEVCGPEVIQATAVIDLIIDPANPDLPVRSETRLATRTETGLESYGPLN